MAINGSFFKPFHSHTFWDYYPYSGDSVDVTGLAISNGETYSDDTPQLPVLCLSPGRAIIRLEGCPPETMQALAGDRLLLEDSFSRVAYYPPSAKNLHPRTAVAVDTSGKILWLVVVDGRQSNYSEGVTLAELADILLELGADIALNLDGGGSSTLVMAGPGGAQALNAPIHTRIPMRQRPVANHLGVYALPLEK
jgi:exopolysaccharide biosynthesis protein